MSGPKVVRIVTREELQVIGRGHLERAADSIQELEKAAKDLGRETAAMSKELARRQEHLRELYQRDRWEELRAQSQDLAEFATAESQRLRAEAIAEAKIQRQKRLRIRDAALSLMSAYKMSGREPPADLRRAASDTESSGERDVSGLQSTLNAAFCALNPGPPPSVVSEKQRELAMVLGAGEKTETFAEWLAGRDLPSDRIQDPRLLSLLAEIEVFEGKDSKNRFLARAQTIVLEDSESRRALLTDSLVLDLSAQCKNRREWEALAANLREARGALTALGTPSALELAAQITTTLASLDQEKGSTLLQAARKTLESETAVLAAAARRRAVLEGLATLGYEVREAMATAWVKEGRIVVGKPGAADYGVELGSPADAGRMQVRLVASDRPTAHRDARRDFDMETSWCNEFQQLKARLAKSGTEVVIEKAMGIGVLPLKTVSAETHFPSTGGELRISGRASRTLPGM